MRCETFSGAGNIITMPDAPRRYTANMKGLEAMLKCLCHHCKNRAIGCHKFCSDYRKYRRELEAMKAESKKADEGTRDYIGSFLKPNSRRK